MRSPSSRWIPPQYSWLSLRNFCMICLLSWRFFSKSPGLLLLSLPAYVTAKAQRGSPGLPPFDGEVQLALRGCSVVERLALCSFVFAPSFRSAATAGGLVSRLGRRSEEHTSELQSQSNLVCRLLLDKKKHTRHKPA